jgi:hypothetical protein
LGWFRLTESCPRNVVSAGANARTIGFLAPRDSPERSFPDELLIRLKKNRHLERITPRYSFESQKGLHVKVHGNSSICELTIWWRTWHRYLRACDLTPRPFRGDLRWLDFPRMRFVIPPFVKF